MNPRKSPDGPSELSGPSREMILERVQARLDARRDPLEDPVIRASLPDHPDLLDEVVALRSVAIRLTGLGSADAEDGPSRFASGLRFAVAASLLALLPAILLVRGFDGTGSAPVARTPSRILDYRLESRLERPSERIIWTATPERIRLRRIQETNETSAGAPSGLEVQMEITRSRERSIEP